MARPRTDEGQADGATVDEGADTKGGSETEQGEEGGAAAGESGNTSSDETGAEKGSATSSATGLGQGGGLLVGAGGVVSNAQSGTPAAPDYTTPSDPTVTDPVSLTAGKTVQLDSSYVAASFAVGNGSANTTVDTGDVVDDDGTLYRYIGASPLTGVDFSSSSNAPDFTVAANWRRSAAPAAIPTNIMDRLGRSTSTTRITPTPRCGPTSPAAAAPAAAARHRHPAAALRHSALVWAR